MHKSCRRVPANSDKFPRRDAADALQRLSPNGHFFPASASPASFFSTLFCRFFSLFSSVRLPCKLDRLRRAPREETSPACTREGGRVPRESSATVYMTESLYLHALARLLLSRIRRQNMHARACTALGARTRRTGQPRVYREHARETDIFGSVGCLFNRVGRFDPRNSRMFKFSDTHVSAPRLRPRPLQYARMFCGCGSPRQLFPRVRQSLYAIYIVRIIRCAGVGSPKNRKMRAVETRE